MVHQEEDGEPSEAGTEQAETRIQKGTAMKYPEQVRKDAKAAADYIRKHGWCQRSFVTHTGSCCALGAKNAVIFGECDPWNVDDTTEQNHRSTDLRRAFISEAGIDSNLSDIPDWNDSEGRTSEQVIGVYDSIANS